MQYQYITIPISIIYKLDYIFFIDEFMLFLPLCFRRRPSKCWTTSCCINASILLRTFIQQTGTPASFENVSTSSSTELLRKFLIFVLYAVCFANVTYLEIIKGIKFLVFDQFFLISGNSLQTDIMKKWTTRGTGRYKLIIIQFFHK